MQTITVTDNTVIKSIDAAIAGDTCYASPEKLNDWGDAKTYFPSDRTDRIRISEKMVVDVDHCNQFAAVCATCNIEQSWPDGYKRLFALQFALAEIEHAIPIMRALIEREVGHAIGTARVLIEQAKEASDVCNV